MTKGIELLWSTKSVRKGVILLAQSIMVINHWDARECDRNIIFMAAQCYLYTQSFRKVIICCRTRLNAEFRRKCDWELVGRIPIR